MFGYKAENINYYDLFKSLTQIQLRLVASPRRLDREGQKGEPFLFRPPPSNSTLNPWCQSAPIHFSLLPPPPPSPMFEPLEQDTGQKEIICIDSKKFIKMTLMEWLHCSYLRLIRAFLVTRLSFIRASANKFITCI